MTLPTLPHWNNWSASQREWVGVVVALVLIGAGFLAVRLLGDQGRLASPTAPQTVFLPPGHPSMAPSAKPRSLGDPGWVPRQTGHYLSNVVAYTSLAPTTPARKI